jgi:hypothetical protein
MRLRRAHGFLNRPAPTVPHQGTKLDNTAFTFEFNAV